MSNGAIRALAKRIFLINMHLGQSDQTRPKDGCQWKKKEKKEEQKKALLTPSVSLTMERDQLLAAVEDFRLVSVV